MPEFLTIDDLDLFGLDIDPGKAEAMIADATALALLAAPCLNSETLTDDQLAGAKAILRAAILRWHDAGTGAVSQQTAGPFGQMIDTRQPRRGMFWPSEISDLQRICATPSDGGAYQIDTMPGSYGSYAWTGPDTWIPSP